MDEERDLTPQTRAMGATSPTVGRLDAPMVTDAGASDAVTPASLSRSGSAKRQRSGMVNFRATDAERVLIEAAAERAGLSVGSYVRSRVLAEPTTRAVRRPTVERAALAQLLGQLGKCGNNLNQVARVLNSGEETPPNITAAIEDFRATCGDIMRVLARQPRKGSEL